MPIAGVKVTHARNVITATQGILDVFLKEKEIYGHVLNFMTFC